jgi:hypothetical protein
MIIAECLRHAVTGSLDGKLIVWDCWTGNKIQEKFALLYTLLLTKKAISLELHCKKGKIIPSLARMSLTKLSMAWNNLIIYGLGEFG